MFKSFQTSCSFASSQPQFLYSSDKQHQPTPFCGLVTLGYLGSPPTPHLPLVFLFLLFPITLIPGFQQCLFSTYYVLDTMPRAGNERVNHISMIYTNAVYGIVGRSKIDIKQTSKEIDILLTLEEHGFELCRSTYTWIFCVCACGFFFLINIAQYCEFIFCFL